MPTEQLTIPQYAKKYTKVKRHAILKSVKGKKMHLLPGVVKTTRIGRYFILEVTT